MEKSKFHFTKRAIEKLPLPEKKPFFLWDDEVRGFGIKLNPTGKVFVAQGRVGNKTRRITIGEFGIWTLDNARKKAQQHLLDIANGIDPNKQKKIEEVRAKTLKEVVEDYVKDRNLKLSSIRDINKHLNGTFKDWKNQPITVISRNEVLKIFRKKSESAPAQANQAFRLLRAWLNYAMAAYRPDNKPILIENPVKVISDSRIWNYVPAKKRRIPIEHIGKAWNLLEGLKADPAQTYAARSMTDAVCFCLLTGARWGEVQKLTWGNVNLDVGTWHIADAKNRNNVTLPLSTQAQELLKSRVKLKDNPYVFASNKSKTGHIGPGRFITDQVAKKLQVELSPHDLRRTFRSVAAECAIELWRTKLLMNHAVKNDVTLESYTERQDLEYLRPDIQAISDWIERQGKIASSEKILELKKPSEKAV